MNSSHLESMRHVAGTKFCPRDKISHDAYDGICLCNRSPRHAPAICRLVCPKQGRSEAFVAGVVQGSHLPDFKNIFEICLLYYGLISGAVPIFFFGGATKSVTLN